MQESISEPDNSNLLFLLVDVMSRSHLSEKWQTLIVLLQIYLVSRLASFSLLDFGK